MRVVPPFRGEFGHKIMWHVPAVHAIAPEIVYHEPGEEALYPSAGELREVHRACDDYRRDAYAKDGNFVRMIEAGVRREFPDAQIIRPDATWPKQRFVPQPVETVGIECDVVICPRERDYGASKNWPHWDKLALLFQRAGLRVFAGGAPDSSADVPCPRAWDYGRYLDATLEAMQAAEVVVATDAGLAHLAVLCGRPLVLITHKGRVAPGPVVDQHGQTLQMAYGPVNWKRYQNANHTGSEIVEAEQWNNPLSVYLAAHNLMTPQPETAA